MPSPSRRESALAIVGGPFYGLDPWTAKSWPEANTLTRAERIAVMRATRRGKNIGDARLAPAVIGYAGAVRNTKDRPLRWLQSVSFGFGVFFLVGAPNLGGQGWLWGLVGGLAAAVAYFVAYPLLVRRRAFSKVERAEKLARQVSQQHSTDNN